MVPVGNYYYYFEQTSLNNYQLRLEFVAAVGVDLVHGCSWNYLELVQVPHSTRTSTGVTSLTTQFKLGMFLITVCSCRGKPEQPRPGG
jgi:hypothetical protein